MTTDSPQTGSEEQLPPRLGQYNIEKVLGSGGMGTVYLGHHVETSQLAAIKVLPASMAREQGFIDRFNREIAAMQKMKSSHIVELFESGEEHGTYYYAMEYVAGETLTERLTRVKRIPWREAIEIGVQICRALKAAHNTGIVHRDLKPSNLLLAKDGTVKLTDFGIAQVFATAKLTVTGGILGTAEYMSPEQAEGKRANKQSDIYALGAVMYVMLTGRPPFTGKTTLEIVQKQKYSNFDAPRRIVPEIPHWLDEIVCQCLSKKPEDRYPDAYVLSLRLQEVPKKVDLANSTGTIDVDGASSTSETVVDGAGIPRSERSIGGELFRDLLKAQLEEDQRPSTTFGKWLDNTWVLIGALVFLIAVGFGLSRLNRPNPEKMFARGEELMQKPEGPAWDAARREYFTPLVELDPETWEPQVAPYMQQIELYNFKKQLLGKQMTEYQSPDSQPEAILRQVVELRKQGRIGEARNKLQALILLIETQPEFSQFSNLAEKLLEDLPEFKESLADYRFVKDAMSRADELAVNGKRQEAVEIWKSIVTLYKDDPHLESEVHQAELKILEFQP